jgi:hypothetical protein
MTGAGFRKLALGLPDAEEGSHMAHPDFRVAGKIFATLTDESEERAMVKLTPAQQKECVGRDPGAVVPAQGAWGRAGSTYVELGQVGRAALRSVLVNAWRNVAPKRMVEAFDGLVDE